MSNRPRENTTKTDCGIARLHKLASNIHNGATSAFSVWRPTSLEAIRKMMAGEGTGKGLDIKGKSAKRGRLSAFVPFLQIHDNAHKARAGELLKGERLRVFYKTAQCRDAAVKELQRTAGEMWDRVVEAEAVLESKLDDATALEAAFRSIARYDVESREVVPVDHHAPRSYGLDVEERILWECYVAAQDISRPAQSEHDTGRPSIPEFQTMNLESLRRKGHSIGEPKAVLWQVSDADPLSGRDLVMAYEEHGSVLPVVSDFDCFLIGTRGVTYRETLPKEQVELMKWCAEKTAGIVKRRSNGEGGNARRERNWTLEWLKVLKEAHAKGFHPEIPQFGFGDPKSYSVIEIAVEKLQGAVRHGAECFNYYFPQDIDEYFLVISDTTNKGSVPWKQVNLEELQALLCDAIMDGFTFPINPKWVLADPGWKRVWQMLSNSNSEEVQASLNAWFPPESGMRDTLDNAKEVSEMSATTRLKKRRQSTTKNIADYNLAMHELNGFVPMVDASRSLHDIGVALAAKNDPIAAMTSFEKALRIRQEKLGAGHRDCLETAAAMTACLDDIRLQRCGGATGKMAPHDKASADEAIQVGCSLLRRGDYKAAERVLKGALAHCNKKSEDNRGNRRGRFQRRLSMEARALTAVGNLTKAKGDYDGAKKHLFKALAAATKIERNTPTGCPENSSSSASGNQDLDESGRSSYSGSIFSVGSNSSDNISFSARVVVQRFSQVCSTEEISSKVFEGTREYAEALRKSGDLDQAEVLHKKALGMLLATNSNIIRGIEDRKWNEELQLRQSGENGNDNKYDDAAAISSSEEEVELLRKSDLNVAVSHTQLGCTYFAMKRHSDALLNHKAALQLRVHNLELTDALVSESLNYCAETMVAEGRGAEAIPAALHAVEIRKVAFGTSHPAFAHALGVLAGCYHSAGRSRDALPLVKETLDICEEAFGNPNHANLIPNLMLRGNILSALKEWDAALDSYKRAKSIHLSTFKDGKMALQLAECQTKMAETEKNRDEVISKRRTCFAPQNRYADMDMNALACALPDISRSPLVEVPVSSMRSGFLDPSRSLSGPGPIASQECTGTNNTRGTSVPVIICTDIGKNIDDTIALALVATLTKNKLLDPLAVIATLAPSEERARLARVALDSLGLHAVPVGIGSDGGFDSDDNASSPAIEFSWFRSAAGTGWGDHNHGSPFELQGGLELMTQALEGAEPKSVKILCLSNLKDVAQLIDNKNRLFREKVEEVVIMGGIHASFLQANENIYDNTDGQADGSSFGPDLGTSNNIDDATSARRVYEACKQYGVPTTTVTRFAAYDCPFDSGTLDKLRDTRHLLAVDVRNVNLLALGKIWSRLNYPPGHPRREQLPARCDRSWFAERILGIDSDTVMKMTSNDIEAQLWSGVSKVAFYDPLAVLHCAETYREKHFFSRAYEIEGTEGSSASHRVTGVSGNDTGIVSPELLANDINDLLFQAFELLPRDVFRADRVGSGRQGTCIL